VKSIKNVVVLDRVGVENGSGASVINDEPKRRRRHGGPPRVERRNGHRLNAVGYTAQAGNFPHRTDCIGHGRAQALCLFPKLHHS
jgi:hypothetical protein